MSLATKPLVLVLIATWLSGCATNASSPPTPLEHCTVDYQPQLHEIHRVALITDSEPPIIEAITLGHTRGEGAAEGAAGGAAAGAAVGISTLPASAACGPLAPLCFGAGAVLTGVLTVGGAAVGTAVGVATGSSADTIAEAEANAHAMFDPSYLQTEVLQRAQDYGLANIDLEFVRLPSAGLKSQLEGHVYRGLPDESNDAVLEIELLRISLKSSLEMESRTRLVLSRTGDVLSENQQVFRSESHSLKEWSENNAAQVRETIERGLTVLAEEIIDDNFSLFALKDHEVKLANKNSNDVTNQDIVIRKLFSARDAVKPGPDFSLALLNIPEGKSAIFIYRPKPFINLYSNKNVPVIINDRYLSRLPENGFDCLIVKPGINMIVYPRNVTWNYKYTTIIRESIETYNNEIAYFSVSPGNFLIPLVSIESVNEKQAVNALRGKHCAKMNVVNQE